MKFAIVEIKSHQYLVKENDKIETEKIEAQKGEQVFLDKILLLVDKDQIEIGTPYLNKKIEAQILDQKKSKKIVVFKYKPKTRYRKKKGHRQQKTLLKIIKIPDVSKPTQ